MISKNEIISQLVSSILEANHLSAESLEGKVKVHFDAYFDSKNLLSPIDRMILDLKVKNSRLVEKLETLKQELANMFTKMKHKESVNMALVSKNKGTVARIEIEVDSIKWQINILKEQRRIQQKENLQIKHKEKVRFDMQAKRKSAETHNSNRQAIAEKRNEFKREAIRLRSKIEKERSKLLVRELRVVFAEKLGKEEMHRLFLIAEANVKKQLSDFENDTPINKNN